MRAALLGTAAGRAAAECVDVVADVVPLRSSKGTNSRHKGTTSKVACPVTSWHLVRVRVRVRFRVRFRVRVRVRVRVRPPSPVLALVASSSFGKLKTYELVAVRGGLAPPLLPQHLVAAR